MEETNIAIPFTAEDVKKHLDCLIDFWRKELELKWDDDTATLIAKCYIDAYQCVRKNLFGELKE